MATGERNILLFGDAQQGSGVDVSKEVVTKAQVILSWGREQIRKLLKASFGCFYVILTQEHVAVIMMGKL